MLLWFTEALSGNSIAVNPETISAVFTAVEGEHKGKTVVISGQATFLVKESDIDVVGRINGASKTQ